MLKPFDDHAPDRLIERGDRFLRQLGGDDANLPLLAFFGLANEELRVALAARRRAGAEANDAFAVRDAADERLDALVADLSLAALDLAHGDVTDPTFCRLFPEGPQAITCVPVAEELVAVASLLQRLEGHPLEARFAERLRRGVAEVQETDERLADALDREASAYARERRAEVDWILRAKLTRANLERAGRTHPTIADLLEPIPTC